VGFTSLVRHPPVSSYFGIDMAKPVQARSQKEIDEEFAAFAAGNLKKDERLLKRPAKA
jgi:hypothetical protein